MRNDKEFRLVAEQVARKGATDKQKSKYGVKGLSILSRLSSIDFPRSFPPDSMHLWFENVIPDLVKHWRGKYRAEVVVDVAGTDEESKSSSSVLGSEPSKSSSEDDQDGQPSKRGQGGGGEGLKANRVSGTKKQRTRTGNRFAEPKVITTDDDYNIVLPVWERMSTWIAASSPNVPALFGPVLRNFLEYINQMTAVEWQLFTFLLGPVYLKGVLPDQDYEEFISLVEAIQISCDYVLTQEDLVEIEHRILQFSRYYEKRYYRGEWARLKSCLPVFHQILHVPQALRWAGPMFVYSQWAMERFCGTLAKMAKSRSATNRNIANNISMLEQKNTLVYVVDHGVPESMDEDEDGNIRLATFLTKRLKKARPLDIGITGTLSGPRPSVDNLLFCGPSKIHIMTRYERMCLKAFFFNESVNISADDNDAYNREDAYLDAEVDSFDIPIHCRIYRSSSYNTCLRGDFYPFKSTSSMFRRSDQTRSTSFVRFETSICGAKESHFGEVLYYFTVDIPEEHVFMYAHTTVGSVNLQIREKERGQIRESEDNELLLALVRDFPVHRDGRLLYRESRGLMRVIMASDIHELIGLLCKDQRDYVIRKHTALF